MDEKRNKIFNDIEFHILNDEKPSEYINELSKSKVFLDYPFTLLNDLKATPQSPIHHPEGNAWNHTMLVLDEAAKVRDQSDDKKTFMWAAMLHDIGKPSTTRNRKGKITSYDHDKVGEELARDFLKCLTDDNTLISKVAKLVRWHMQILFVVNNLPFADVEMMKNEVDIEEVALLGYCDRMGRLGADPTKESDNIRKFLTKV